MAKNDEARSRMKPRIELLVELAGDRRGDEHHQAGDEHGLADHQRVVAAHLRQIDRIEIGQAVKPDAEHEGEQAADREIPVGESAQIDDRRARGQHAGEEHDRRDAGNDGDGEDRVVVEPFVARPLLQHIFERAEKAGHAEQAVPVEILQQREVGLVEIDQQRTVAMVTMMPGTTLMKNSQCQE